MKTEYTGVIREMIFHNKENGYTVAVFESEEDAFTIVGNIPHAAVGKTYLLHGDFIEHPTYGEQFKVTGSEEQMPSTKEGIRGFLSSGVLKGIGPKTAAVIVETFGEDTFRVIEEEPEQLVRISGIGPKTAARISSAFAEQREFARVSLQLQKYGIDAGYALRLYQKYGSETLDVLAENPYRLIDDFHGIGFIKADRIAAKLGLEKDDEFRIQSGIAYTLSYYSGEGNTCLPEEELCEQAGKLLDLSRELVAEQVETLVFRGDIHIDRIQGRRMVYLYSYYAAEQNVSKCLRALRGAAPKPIRGQVDQLIRRTEAMTGIELNDNQKDAVVHSLETGVSVITGGPGTGKTTIINTIINILEDSGLDTAIAAPTGRAAKRITETSGHPASTIHRLLEYSFSEESDQLRFGKTADDPLEYDAVIVDEASMIDLMLMDGLVSAIRPGTRFIIVGDDDQLPSVGAGNVLRDIITSEYIYCTRLTKIFRQDSESMIVVNAHRINRGEYPDVNGTDSDFFMVPRKTEKEMLDTIVDLTINRLPSYYEDILPVRDIQILTPVRRGVLGCIQMNERLQSILNPPEPDKEEKAFGDRLFREGDKVMQIKNNYELKWRDTEDFTEGEGVFNGDVGFIQSIDREFNEVNVIFDSSRYVTYTFDQLEELELAYAITVHKSQGSEFPIVLMPVSWFPPVLATRNLLYTGVTRGKTAVVLVGSESKLCAMVDNNRISQRYSGLGYRLAELLKLENEMRV